MSDLSNLNSMPVQTDATGEGPGGTPPSPLDKLKAIRGINLGSTPPVPADTVQTDTSPLGRLRQAQGNPYQIGTNRGKLFSSANVSEYAPYMLGIDPNQNLDEIRAQNQSNFEQLGHAIVRTPFRAALGIAEGAGYLLDFEAVGKTLALGALGQPEYHNWLSDIAKTGKENISEALPIYREQAQKVWNPGDAAWWIDNGAGLVESIGSFFVVGAGLAAGTSKIASGVASLANMMAKGTQIARGAAQVATAGGLAYVEGAMEGVEVYDQVYRLGVEQGLPEAIAKQHASDAAANTVKINTFVNTGLNMTGAMAFFRPMRSQGAITKAGLGMNAGESMSAYLTRLKDTPAKGFMSTLLAESAREAPQEALEEVVNEISSAEGLFKGNALLGVEDGRNIAERVVDVLLTPEAALAATLGAVGGAGQALVTGLAPSLTLKEGDGVKNAAVYKKLQTRGSREHAAIMEAQTQTRTRLIKLVENHIDARNRMQKASEEGNIEEYRKAKDDLFDVITEDRIVTGMEEQLIAGFEAVRDMTPEEAQDAGFDADPDSDEYYKKLADDRIRKSKKLTKRWNEIQDTYNFDSDEHLSRLPYFIFGSEVQIESLNDQLSRVRDAKQKLSADQQAQSMFLDTDVTFDSLLQLDEQRAALDKQKKTLATKIKSTQELMKTDSGRARLQKMYDTYDMDSIILGLNDAVAAIGRRETDIGRQVEQISDSIKESDGMDAYNDWLNKNIAYKEALEEISNIEAGAQTELAEIQTSLNNVLSQRGRRNFSKAFNNELTRLQDIQKEAIKEEIKQAQTREELTQISNQIDPDQTPEISDELERKNAELNRLEDDKARKAEKEILDQKGREMDAQLELEAKLNINQEVPITQRRDFEDLTERNNLLEFMLEIDDRQELDEAFLHFSKLYNLDDDFQRVIFERQSQLSFSNKRQDRDDSLDVSDSATAPDEPTTNRYRSMEEMDDSLDASQEGREETSSSGKTQSVGLKIVEASLALAHLTKDYSVVVDKETGEQIKVEAGEALSENLIPETLSWKDLQEGDDVIFELDTNFVHPETGVTYDELSEGPDAWKNVPIRVVYKGKPVGWIHTVDWVDANQNGNPTNVAHYVNQRNNWEDQKQRIRDLRKRIWKSESMSAVVSHHGIGHLNHSLARNEEGNIERDSRGNAIKERRSVAENTGDNIRFVVSKNGQFFDGRDPVKKELANKEVFPTGQPGILLPTSARRDGKQVWMAVPIWIPTAKDADSQLPSDIFNIIRAFHRPSNAAEVEQLSSALDTQFGSNVDFLSDYIGNFFLSRSFSNSDINNPTVSSKRVFIHVGTDTGDLRIAKHGASPGGGIVYTTNQTHARKYDNARYMFELAPDGSYLHQEAIESLIGDAFLDLKIEKANGQSTINRVTLVDGAWEARPTSYKEFMRNSFSTTVNGQTLPNGEMTYFVQPNIIFSEGSQKPEIVEREAPSENAPLERLDAEEGDPAVPGPEVANDLDKFLLTDEEYNPNIKGTTFSKGEAEAARSDSPFFSYPSAAERDIKANDLESDGDVQVTCKV